VNLVQRKCACGGSAGLSGECAECQKEKLIGQNSPLVQPKLKISLPNDKYEQEADRVANRIMSLPESQGRQTLRSDQSSQVVSKSSNSSHNLLDPQTLSFMESRFGYNFKDVRVRADAKSAASARFFTARAYTVGKDINFAPGEYAPHTQSGRRLLAHELTHVIQQSKGESSGMAVSKTPNIMIQRTPVQNPEIVSLKEELSELLHIKQELLDDISRAGSQGDREALVDALHGIETQITDVLVTMRNLEKAPVEKKQVITKEIYGTRLITTGRGSGGKGPVVYDDPEFKGTPAYRRRQQELGGGILASAHKHSRVQHPMEAFKSNVETYTRGQQVIENLPTTMKESRDRVFQWPVETAVQTVKAASGFFGGFSEGIEKAHLSDDQKEMLLRNAALSSPMAPALYAGMTEGITREAIETLTGILEIKQTMDAMADLAVLILAPGGDKLARELGREASQNVKRRVDELADMSPWTFAYTVGKIVGPILAEIVLWIVSGGASSFARSLVRILDKIPGGRKLINRLRGQSRGKGKLATTASQSEPLHMDDANVMAERKTFSSPSSRKLPNGGADKARKPEGFESTAYPSVGPAEARKPEGFESTAYPSVGPAEARKPEGFEPTAYPTVGPVKARKPKGFEPTGKGTKKRVKAGTMEGLESHRHKPAPKPRGKSVTREQQLQGIEPKSASKVAREEFDKVQGSYAEKLGVGKGGQVHHATELQVLDRYPGAFSAKELNKIENMRGIPPEVGGLRQLHNSKIREIWDRHYKLIDERIEKNGLRPGTDAYNKLVRENIANGVREIDYVLGQFFSENRKVLFQ
jgi:hypothetical protein